jgi:tRNA (guanine37-N1)-methyltransferase
MNTHREVKSVWRQVSSVSGDYRLRRLEFLLGKKTTETLYKEHGCIYKTDLRKTYFSPRLSYERLRIARLTRKGETVLNMFAGVGCYSISIAKHAEPLKVYSVDVNPYAYQYLRENIRLNRVEKTVVPIQGDAKTVTENRLQNVVDRVLMPLPEKAYEYLDYALYALKPTGGWIHYYDFEYANRKEDAVEKAEKKVSTKLQQLRTGFHVEFGRTVRPIGPRWYQVVLDIHIQNQLDETVVPRVNTPETFP